LEKTFKKLRGKPRGIKPSGGIKLHLIEEIPFYLSKCALIILAVCLFHNWRLLHPDFKKHKKALKYRLDFTGICLFVSILF